MGEADGSIMPVIMTAHIAQSSSKCGACHRVVIIHALAPVIEPYMSRAITTMQIHDTSGTRTSSTTTGLRCHCNANSKFVGRRSSGAAGCAMNGSIYPKHRETACINLNEISVSFHNFCSDLRRLRFGAALWAGLPSAPTSTYFKKKFEGQR